MHRATQRYINEEITEQEVNTIYNTESYDLTEAKAESFIIQKDEVETGKRTPNQEYRAEMLEARTEAIKSLTPIFRIVVLPVTADLKIGVRDLIASVRASSISAAILLDLAVLFPVPTSSFWIINDSALASVRS